MASGRIVPNLMDVAFSALSDLRHTDAHRVNLSRVRVAANARVGVRVRVGVRIRGKSAGYHNHPR